MGFSLQVSWGRRGWGESREGAGLAQTLFGPPDLPPQGSAGQGVGVEAPAGLWGVTNRPRGLLRLKRTFA